MRIKFIDAFLAKFRDMMVEGKFAINMNSKSFLYIAVNNFRISNLNGNWIIKFLLNDQMMTFIFIKFHEVVGKPSQCYITVIFRLTSNAIYVLTSNIDSSIICIVADIGILYTKVRDN